MKVLWYAPESTRGEEREIAGDLESMQGLVGGLIQEVPRGTLPHGFKNIVLWVNEEGIPLELKPNRALGHRLLGPVFFAHGHGSGDLSEGEVKLIRSHFDV